MRGFPFFAHNRLVDRFFIFMIRTIVGWVGDLTEDFPWVAYLFYGLLAFWLMILGYYLFR